MTTLETEYNQKKAATAIDVLRHIKKESDIVVPIAVGEPRTLIEALPTYTGLEGNRLYQMLSLWPVITIEQDRLRIISMFLGSEERKAFREGKLDLLPNHFSDVPALLKEIVRSPVVMAQSSPMDEQGYFSLGTNADYVMSLISSGATVLLEVNNQMPYTYGENHIHLTQVMSFFESDCALPTAPPMPSRASDKKIGSFCADLIEDGSVIQIGFGAIPNAIMDDLHNHRHLTIHTEMIPDKIVDLIESGAVTNEHNPFSPGCMTATFAYGSKKLYSFMNQNEKVHLLPVERTNDSYQLSKIEQLITINAALEVDLLGQCNAEVISGKYYSSTGGQSDFGIGARKASRGRGIICLHASAKDGTISKIVPRLSEGAVVTTSKNDVDYVVTEYGVAKLRGKTVSERTTALIAIAHPQFREELKQEAERMGFLPLS
ncbi:acetyl-CoA hydrolase/transferase family protein [Shouchella patagoniensis]|uniref:acetyl-CoA hydrolase/transferase family protein n=1 Tax=Shouchella patagoniensis TaxID=228576 RepID=UPI000994CBF2|nr:acetyl-CoA hydrolase/transferase C-terminal domain-containing protein [Shouchella patagoniensis]